MADLNGLAERLRVVVIADPTARPDPVEAARAAVRAGTPCIQLRWKNGTTAEIFAMARELRKVTTAGGALLIVNDRLDIALAADADGAHLGDDDLPLAEARRIVPRGFILGRSVDNPDEAGEAERLGADYVGLGPVYPTGSKAGLGNPIGPAGVTATRARVSLSIVAIGGITASTAAEVRAAGADGIAVIGAVMMADDPEDAARRMLAASAR